MNTAAIASAGSARHGERPTLPGRIVRLAALALSRVRRTPLDEQDASSLHELRREADRLRTENFRAVAVGRLL